MLTGFVIRKFGWWYLKSRISASGLEGKFYRYLYRETLRYYGCWIGLEATFAGRPILPHNLYGIFISNRARIGSNCVIFHQVTIGSNSIPDSSRPGSPIIGDNCYIGAGAKIIGGITVGNNVRIGANCVVTEDIPDNSVVVSQRARVIPRENMNNRFYAYSGTKWMYEENDKWNAETDPDIIESLNNAFLTSAAGGKQ